MLQTLLGELTMLSQTPMSAVERTPLPRHHPTQRLDSSGSSAPLALQSSCPPTQVCCLFAALQLAMALLLLYMLHSNTVHTTAVRNLINGQWATSLFGLVFRWVFSLSPKTNVTPEFLSQSEVLISWAKTAAVLLTFVWLAIYSLYICCFALH